MGDQNGELPAGVRPMQVAMCDGMPISSGPSAMKSGLYIPEEYGGNIDTNVKEMFSGIADIAEQLSHANKIRKGIKQISKGFTKIYAPFPTWIDEAMGLGQIAYGGYQIIMGVGELIVRWITNE